jgi:hypothetical protein
LVANQRMAYGSGRSVTCIFRHIKHARMEGMSNERHVEKIQKFKRIKKGQRLCHICLKRSRSKNMFSAARRGTC